MCRRDPRWSKLYLSLVKRGKPQCVAIAAVANRWVRSMHHRMLDVGEPGGGGGEGGAG